ncbi:hypothetical protein LE190_08620 [Massilia oculi]|uniref:Uncharacterized protein n=1 Tax=Massilia hydrophila TaxID=3044279 RepID=A0ABS7Y8H3_9BURK|nr:hypothetical protein [Massilia oculi]MCA1855985.1 hypothetical protein [Massilia oculi]
MPASISAGFADQGAAPESSAKGKYVNRLILLGLLGLLASPMAHGYSQSGGLQADVHC